MKKLIYRTIISSLFILFVVIVYISTIGIKTDKFNNQIISQIKNIEPNLEIKINDVSAKLNIFDLTLEAKTVGTNLKLRNKIIKLESIKSKISIDSLVKKKFALSEISISTKSILLKDLIGFIRLHLKDPKLFIAEQFVNNGYIVATLKLEFDEFGKMKDNYEVNGLVNNGGILILNRELNELNFNFQINDRKFKFTDIDLLFNNKKIFLPKLDVNKHENEFLVSGKLKGKKLNFDKKELENLIDNIFFKKNLKEISFNFESDFNFKLGQNFKIKDHDIKSEINLNYLKISNFLKLKKIFPKIKDDLILENQKLNFVYNKKGINLIGSGKVFLQTMPDMIEYKISNKNKQLVFNSNLIISDNPFIIDLINFEKKEKSKLNLNFKGRFKNKKLFLQEISVSENKNKLIVKNLDLSEDYKINDISYIQIDFVDKEKFTNKLEVKKNEKNYNIVGDSLNINKIITEFLNTKNNDKQKILNKNLSLIFDIKEIYLDKNNITYNLGGSIILKKDKISELNLAAEFLNNKKINFTIKTSDKGEKITTLFSNEAKPLVDRYKFINGFEEGKLDFYSIKNNEVSKSTLKLYDFKLKEIPTLTKILTLASLQGIADLLSGEGIRFNDFEMKFSNKDNLMTIDEIYAIGPAISLLMEGYVEKDNLISLRGTLVPATTINKTISSIPLLGDILVGKKTGEGVFGVSFKIKGPPKNLETTVNPIKTLTPRFITRTLEKIKKN